MIDGHRVLDAHVHLQPWSMLKPAVRAVMERSREDVGEQLRYQADRGAFEAHLEAEGVDAAVLVNYVSPDVMGFGPEVNDWVSKYVEGSSMLLAMGSVHPRTVPKVHDEVDRLAQKLGIRALKVHPAHQLLYPHQYALDLPALADVYDGAAEHQLPVTIHTGTSIFPGAKNRFTEPIYVDDVAVDFPETTILLAHAGRPFWMEQAMFLARRHENVYLEISGIPPKKLLEYLPRLPEIDHKVVWGSDWPSPGVRSLRKNVQDFLARPGLSDAAKGRILWETGARLFRL
jgi:predicted TIM-barrel fold metal-dependent hydrolase